MQQLYQPTPTNIIHITLDLRCNKAFKNRRVVVCLKLTCVTAVVSSRRSQVDTNTTSGSPSPKLDRHDPKYSYKLHVYK
jgi:hypothetical protein